MLYAERGRKCWRYERGYLRFFSRSCQLAYREESHGPHQSDQHPRMLLLRSGLLAGRSVRPRSHDRRLTRTSFCKNHLITSWVLCTEFLVSPNKILLFTHFIKELCYIVDCLMKVQTNSKNVIGCLCGNRRYTPLSCRRT